MHPGDGQSSAVPKIIKSPTLTLTSSPTSTGRIAARTMYVCTYMLPQCFKSLPFSPVEDAAVGAGVPGAGVVGLEVVEAGVSAVLPTPSTRRITGHPFVGTEAGIVTGGRTSAIAITFGRGIHSTFFNNSVLLHDE